VLKNNLQISMKKTLNISNGMKKIILFLIPVIFLFGGISLVNAQETETNLYMFGRKDCNYCELEKDFLNNLLLENSDFKFIYLDTDNPEVKSQFIQLTELHNIPKATPITLVGNSLIQGFNSANTTGRLILSEIENQKGKPTILLKDYLVNSDIILSQDNSVCDDTEDSISCTVGVGVDTEIKVPVLGVVDFKDFSLFSMSVLLGFVDGFNPCAMWVLLTFLLVLWQIGNRKKMFQVAGLFIFAEAIMYWLILNFWFTAWDFVGLDRIIIPAVGGLAILGGIYFLKRYFKNRNKLVCDVTSEEYKSKTEKKIKDLIKSPMTILTALGIVGIALSINVIEFACSVGIPQTFTKVLEINNLGVAKEQFYILIYTLFYMVDDFVLFGLALYGFDKFYTVGQKYSNISSLIGGILMIILGVILIFNPSLLMF
jgi:cytochrome c biogenesis protein CcdA